MTTLLNPILLEQQACDEIDEVIIQALHSKREQLFTSIERDVACYGIKYCRAHGYVKRWIDELRNLEFALQRAWGFEEREAKHSWWYEIPYCTCPNHYAKSYCEAGLPIRITALDCPIHGNVLILDED